MKLSTASRRAVRRSGTGPPAGATGSTTGPVRSTEPGVVWLGEGFGLTFRMPTGFLWGAALILSMLLMLYATVTNDGDDDVSGAGSGRGAPADD
ncbi:hypothetical protein [Halovivax cerinus]|uniref:DUF8059 domain-containing protein n=1 Tax=Halovivax cerinus TaxID=1487865 RepID=A0ABD5NT79_9EURY|nr:hypothetical protein [Halovivax cerinus]